MKENDQNPDVQNVLHQLNQSIGVVHAAKERLIRLGDESYHGNDQKEANRNGDHQAFLRVVQIQIDREQDHGHEGQKELISHYQNIA